MDGPATKIKAERASDNPDDIRATPLGRWYLGVLCRKCRQPILFALDHNDGSMSEAPASAGKLVLTCALEKCRHRDDYTSAAVSRFQKQPERAEEAHESRKTKKPA